MLQPNQICHRCMSKLATPGEPCPICGAINTRLHNLQTQLPIGSILAGKYFVGCTLGQGGFGITYIGLDLNRETKVAIKEYFPDGFVGRDATTQTTVTPAMGEKGLFFQTGRVKFVEEAKTLARFSADEGIVSVRAFFNENETAYIVMNFVEGKTLKSLAAERGGKLPSAEVLSYFSSIIDSMGRVHDAGLLHRDISPDNIIVRPDGQAVLLDFGAARQISAMGEHSNTINVKHGFAPEEQYRTHGAQGAWTDIYALCATIYRLTTGVTPPQAVDRAMTNSPITPPNALGAGFTLAQQAAIMKGLSIHGRDRQQSMAELKRGLFGIDDDSATRVETGDKTHPIKDILTNIGRFDKKVGKALADKQPEPKKRKMLLWIGAAVAAAIIVVAIAALAEKGNVKDKKAISNADGRDITNMTSDSSIDDAGNNAADMPEIALNPSNGPVLQVNADDIMLTMPGFRKGEEIYSDKNFSLVYYDYSYYDFIDSIQLEFRFENKTDKKLTLNSDWLCVNGIDYSTDLFASADGHMTTEAYIRLDNAELAAAKISKFKEITFDCEINDESYDNAYNTGVISLTDPAVIDYRQPTDPLDIIIFESSALRISCKPIKIKVDDSVYTVNCLVFCLENKSTDSLRVRCNNFLLNGNDTDNSIAFHWRSIRPNAVRYKVMTIERSVFEAGSITEGNDYLTFEMQVTQGLRNIAWETRDFGYHLLSNEVILDGKTLSKDPRPYSPADIVSAPAAENIGATFEHGSWEGYTFTNRSIGISFTVPQSWAIFTDDELSSITNDSSTKLEALAGELKTGNAISIMCEPYAGESAEDMTARIIKESSSRGDIAYNSVRSGEQLLSGQRYSYIDLSESADGSKELARFFFRACGDTMVLVTIVTCDGTPISDITAMFG